MQSNRLRGLQLGLAFSATLAVAFVGLSFRGETHTANNDVICGDNDWPIAAVECSEFDLGRSKRLKTSLAFADFDYELEALKSATKNIKPHRVVKADRLPILNETDVYLTTVEERGAGYSNFRRLAIETSD